MTGPTNLNKERAERAGDNRLWKPEDMLREVLRRIEAGEITTDRMMVLYWEPVNGDFEEAFETNHYVSGLTRSDVLAMLEMMKFDLMDDWRGTYD